MVLGLNLLFTQHNYLSHSLILPTKEAVDISVMSKRWCPLWLYVSTLCFNNQTYMENKEIYFRFLWLVYIVMLLLSQPKL
ncbi:hypothetical protein CR513_05771, partial [Mucuna pruriens]